ncbi:MAG: flagellar biosynthesis anti-sigma factor FlgM [Burkholderiaceae bacterium]
MKIQAFDTSKPVLPASDNVAAQAVSQGVKPPATPTGPEASAKLALSALSAQAPSESRADFDAEKVARIAQAIRDGKFNVNAEKIADGLIAQSREFMSGNAH